jgi:hypothetical protein
MNGDQFTSLYLLGTNILDAVHALKPAPRCSCTHEAGDSDCAVHPTCNVCGADLAHLRALKPAQGPAEKVLWEELVDKREKVERLQAVVGDQALTIATLKDELAQTRHLLEEERALTAATVGSARAAQP